MDRRSFLVAAAAAPFALREPRAPLALVTADLESHVALVDLAAGVVRKRIATRPGPRSIERVGETALVAHTAVGEVSVLHGASVRHVIEGFEEPRYTAAAPDGRHAFVTDSGRADLAAVDVVRGRVVARLRLRAWPRHLSLASGRLWVALGTASAEIAVVDVRDPRRLVLERYIRPGFLAHDVGFAPDGRAWLTGGEQSTIAVYEAGAFRFLPAGPAPQHVTFLGRRVFVTSGDDGTFRIVGGPKTRVPVGSYNVQLAGNRIITPSLNAGTLTVLDGMGEVHRTIRVAASSHDACRA